MRCVLDEAAGSRRHAALQPSVRKREKIREWGKGKGEMNTKTLGGRDLQENISDFEEPLI
jgi:hypothetical protein